MPIISAIHAFPEQLPPAAFLMLAYAIGVAGNYLSLRRYGFGRAVSLALGIPLTQAVFSFVFQAAFLLGFPLLAACGGTILVAAATAQCIRLRSLCGDDARHFARMAKASPWVAGFFVLLAVYSLAQTLLLPVRNYDALTYHLPRVFLFIQADGFFLESFNRYHEAVFPVGADILYYPFVALGLAYGMPVFCLSSYLALGASSYVIARFFADRRIAVVAALALLSMTEIVLQSTGVKNDILMAAAAGACLVTILQIHRGNLIERLLLLAVLGCYGLSTKTTFLAAAPGLILFLFWRFRPWTRIFRDRLAADWRRRHAVAILGAACLCFVLSNIWLFAWNIHSFGHWSGPEEFTHRHTQHEGLKGTAANALRYGLQILQINYVTDVALTKRLDIEPFSARLNDFYDSWIKPAFGSAGASREDFRILWLTEEKIAWFGPLGALFAFVCVPLALFRFPRRAFPVLLPALLYFLLLCAKVSWMPWNSRFFTTFFLFLIPAFALTFYGAGRPAFLRATTVVCLGLLTLTKLTDFSNPLILPAEPDHPKLATQRFFTKSTKEMTWPKLLARPELHSGNPNQLLAGVPPGGTVAIYTNGHHQHYDFFRTRPDIVWVPLDRIRGEGSIDDRRVTSLFFENEFPFMLMLKAKVQGTIEIRSSADKTAVLLVHPKTRPRAQPEP